MIKSQKNRIIYSLSIFLILLSVLGIPKTVHAEVQTEKSSFLLESDRVLDGVYGEESLYFQISENWQVTQGKAVFHVKVSPMILDIPAELTFSFNGVPVQSVKLDYANGEEQDFETPLPKELWKSGYNNLTVSGFAQIYDEEGCLEEFSGANWVILDKSSGVEVEYQKREPGYTVAEYPYPIFSGDNENGEGTAILVPDKASLGELTAAAWIRAGLASGTAKADEVKMLYLSGQQEAEEGQIVISSWEKLSKEQKKTIAGHGIREEELSKNAAIVVERMENGYCRVLITSKEEECLTEAAQFLMDESRTSQVRESAVLVPLKSSEELKKSAKETQKEIFVSDLTGNESGLEFRGAFRREQTLYPGKGEHYLLGTEDTLNLNIRYSDNLEFKKSLLTVYVNGKPIGSKRLEKEKAQGEELKMTIPEDLSGEQLKSITFAFDLEIEDLYCTVRQDEMPWAFLTGDSSITLYGGGNRTPSFERLPYPFVKHMLANDWCFVLPEEPTKEELSLFGQIASLYGDGMRPYGDLSVSFGEKSDYRDKNAVFIGTFEDYKKQKELNENLAFSMDIKEKKFVGNEMFAFSDAYAKQVASMQLVPSLENRMKTWLVIAAPSEDSLENLTSYLKTRENREKLEGDVILVDSNQEMRTFTFRDEAFRQERPTLRERYEKNKEPVIFTVIASAALLLLLLASVLIFIRAHAAGKKGK